MGLTRVESKSRPHKRFKTSVTWDTSLAATTVNRKGLPRRNKRAYGGAVRHGFGPEVKVTTVA